MKKLHQPQQKTEHRISSGSYSSFLNPLKIIASTIIAFFFVGLMSFLPNQVVCATDNNTSETHASWAKKVDMLEPLWHAISERNEADILSYLKSNESIMVETALRGLANMTIENITPVFEMALSDSQPLAWFTLSTQQTDSGKLREIEAHILKNETPKASVIGGLLVLGQKGDPTSHKFLVNLLENGHFSGEHQSTKWSDTDIRYAFALSLSRSALRTPLSSEQNFSVLKHAITAETAMEQSAWMYAWYRSGTLQLDKRTLDGLVTWSSALWNEAHGITRQYWIQILGKNHDPRVMDLLDYEFLRHAHSLEAIEASRTIFRFTRAADRRTRDFVPLVSEEIITQKLVALLMHENVSVRLEVLQSITDGNFDVPICIEDELYFSLTDGTSMIPAEWMMRVQALARCSKEKARRVMEEYPRNWSDNPHMVGSYISSIRSVYIIDDAIDQLNSLSKTSSEAILVEVVSQLSFIAMEEPENNEIRAIVAEILRGVAQSESDRVAMALAVSDGALDWLSDATDEKFIAAINYGNSLRNPEFDSLLKPDAALIKRLGPHPKWTILTEKGQQIDIRLDALRSPATVTALAKITESGWHVGTPFHRVVNNFVIQGGAIWSELSRNDPPFRVPTEATELEFSRGAVGIASAGRDTEGSQFFVMHMWHPHLNGGYSNIGRVVSGMDVVDQISEGIRVLGTSVEPGW